MDGWQPQPYQVSPHRPPVASDQLCNGMQNMQARKTTSMLPSVTTSPCSLATTPPCSLARPSPNPSPTPNPKPSSNPHPNPQPRPYPVFSPTCRWEAPRRAARAVSSSRCRRRPAGGTRSFSWARCRSLVCGLGSGLGSGFGFGFGFGFGLRFGLGFGLGVS